MANYEQLDIKLEVDQNAARARGDSSKVDQLRKDRDDLARSFTVLLFGQFEQAVNEKFVEVRTKMLGHPNWSSRRGWDTEFMNRETWRIPFNERLAIVMDKTDPTYEQILSDFSLMRHGFAHGVLTSTPTPPRQTVQSLYAYQGMLSS